MGKKKSGKGKKAARAVSDLEREVFLRGGKIDWHKPASHAYEAAIPTPSLRPPLNAGGSQDYAADSALQPIREWGRYLDENHDLAATILDDLVNNIVGTGIVTIPMPLREDGSVDEALGAEIMKLRKRWTRRVDVTGELGEGEAQRLICRAWMRDGEEFIQHVAGRERGYPFARDVVPYRIELIESDFCPRDLTGDNGWRQGVRRNAWNMPLEYAFYLSHPGDSFIGQTFGTGTFLATLRNTKQVPAQVITHIKLAKRWPATRGISVFAPVISRLYDVKDIEESERIKDRILASWAAAIQKSPDVPGDDGANSSGRRFQDMFAGTLIDSLAPGETIVGVGPDYPVENMADYIADQIRRISGGTGTRYSSISKRYDGSYSAQRQELVESKAGYKVREDPFVAKVVRETHERLVITALLDGKLAIGGGENALERAMNAEYRGPATPWIDKLKEVQADVLAIDNGLEEIDDVRIKRGAPASLIGTPRPTQRQPAQLTLLPNDKEEAAA